MIYVTEDTNDNVPLRGKAEITWQDSRSGWGHEPSMGGWSWSEDPPLDPHLRRLPLVSILDWAEQQDDLAPSSEPPDDEPVP